MKNSETGVAKRRSSRKQPKPRILKARGYDENGHEVVRFFDRGPIKVLVDPLPFPLFLDVQ